MGAENLQLGSIIRLVESTRGNIIFDGIDLTKLNSLQMIPYRRQIQMIFQDPFASLNPRMPVGDIIAEPLIVHKFGSKADAIDRVKLLLERVGLNYSYFSRYPYYLVVKGRG